MQKERPFCNSAMKYGQMAENFAKEKLKEYFQNHVNAELIPSGFKIDAEYGFLGASPDCMVICDCHTPALVEIKCPARGRSIKIKRYRRQFKLEN